MDCITFCYSEPKFINKNIFEKYEETPMKGVLLVDDQGLEAVRKVAESLINKGVQGLLFQIVCQKIQSKIV